MIAEQAIKNTHLANPYIEQNVCNNVFFFSHNVFKWILSVVIV